jgi:uncharacterized protein (DUF2235 family)
MSKRIIFCADGTWDTPQNKTNVYKLFKALSVTAEQLPFYDDGVGSDGLPLEKLAGGAMGLGLFQKIKDGYTKIAHAYEQGDDVFIFGFSRGAYTARSLAGMIANCGLPTKDFDDNLVGKAFEAYRDKLLRQTILDALTPQYGLFDACIRMVGVWDTVGALGIPSMIGKVDPVLYGFLDTGLHPDVKNACHALAVDERRCEFPATLWTSTPAAGQHVEQVWFSGVHCDVGGGYPETGLSDITLSWMMGKANALGVQFADDAWSLYKAVDPKNALDQIHESWNLIWGFPHHRSIAANSSLANSVAIRWAHNSTYNPENLTLTNCAPAAGYSIVPVVAPPQS